MLQFGNFSFTDYREEKVPSVLLVGDRRNDGVSSSYYDDHFLKEEEVRRLHSFLSQWLETNQKDYF